MKHRLIFRASDKAEFQALVEGRKSIETRAATPKYRKVEVGDTLVISCGGEQIEKTVRHVSIYDSIDSLLANEKLAEIMPLAKDEAEARKAWHSYPGYDEKIAKYGIVAWQI